MKTKILIVAVFLSAWTYLVIRCEKRETYCVKMECESSRIPVMLDTVGGYSSSRFARPIGYTRLDSQKATDLISATPNTLKASFTGAYAIVINSDGTINTDTYYPDYTQYEPYQTFHFEPCVIVDTVYIEGNSAIGIRWSNSTLHYPPLFTYKTEYIPIGEFPRHSEIEPRYLNND